MATIKYIKDVPLVTTVNLTDKLAASQGGTYANTISVGQIIDKHKEEVDPHAGKYARPLGVDDNYVTDAEKVKLSNLSGTNTGDQDLSGYSLTTHNHTGVYQPAGTYSTDIHSNITALNSVSGVNTGDQDLSGYSLATHNHTGTYEPANSNIQSHISSTSNPHNVTAAQAGADPAGTAAGLVSTHASSSDHDGRYYTETETNSLLSGKQNTSEKGQALGYCPLDGSAKVAEAYLPDSVLGQVEYQGVWNATTNTPAIPAASTANKGWYYIVSVSGTTTIDGISEWTIGDWIISNGTAWTKIDNTDSVSSVFGRAGAIVANAGDYTASQITNVPAGNIAATTVQAAINELDTEKASTTDGRFVTNGDSHDHVGGDGAAITEGALRFSDVTTGNASYLKHGLMPKTYPSSVAVTDQYGNILYSTGQNGLPLIGTLSGTPMFNKLNIASGTNVTGILAVANGGTGSSTQNFVDLTTDQTIAGNKTFSSPIIAPAGTAALPALTTAGDTNTGVHFPAADTVGIATGGVSRFTFGSTGNFTSTNSSNVNQLTLQGTNATVGGTVAQLVFSQGTDTIASVQAVNAGSIDSGYLTFNTQATGSANTERARITSTGALLVNATSDPTGLSAKHYVNGLIGAINIQSGYTGYTNYNSLSLVRSDQSAVGQTDKAAIDVVTGNGSARFLHINADATTITAEYRISRDGGHSWHTGSTSTEKARITSTGNLLVGRTTETTIPKLQVGFANPVSSPAYAAAVDVAVFNSLNTAVLQVQGPTISGIGFSSDTVRSAGYIGYTHGGTDTMTFRTAQADKMYLFSDGNLSIGNGTNQGYKLYVNGTTAVSGNLGVSVLPNDLLTLYVNKTTASAETTGIHVLQQQTVAGSNFFGADLRAYSAHTTGTLANQYGVRTVARATGAGGAITTLYGFYSQVDAPTGTPLVGTAVGFAAGDINVGATNTYGFLSNISSGTGKWNICSIGTASNYLAGNTLIGSTTDHPNPAKTQITSSILGLSVKADTADTVRFWRPVNSVSAAAGRILFGGYVDTSTYGDYASIGAIIENSASATKAGALAFSTATAGTLTEKARLTAAGELLIGTSSQFIAGYQIQTNSENNGVAGTYLRNGNTGTAANTRIGLGSSNDVFQFIKYGSGYTGRANEAHIYNGTGDIYFSTNAGNERLRITQAGSILINTATDPGYTAKLHVAGGMSFDNVANANSRVLDWYEEGTFTPTAIGTTTAGTGTYTIQYGSFTRIGNRVMFQLNVAWSAHTGTGDLRIAGLPYATNGSSNNIVTHSITCDTLTVGTGKQLTCISATSESTIRLIAIDLAGGASSYVAMDTAVTNLRISGQYQV